jgi:hypothetical protein
MALLQPGVRDGALSPGGREVFAGIGRAFLEGSLPAGSAFPGAMAALLERIDGLVAALPPHSQSELSQLLALLASAPGRRLLAGVREPWHRASVPQIQGGLHAMRASDLSLRRQAFHALRDIVASAYFSHPDTWGVLGYPGPVKI